MLKGITVHHDVMRKAAGDGFITATDLADYLVRKACRFRQAHDIVGKAVLRASRLGCGLGDMRLRNIETYPP